MTPHEAHVGTGVYIFKDGTLLLGKRRGAHGAGEYAGTGGMLHPMESFEDCARRETREETGIELKNLSFLCVANMDIYAPRHHILVAMRADWASGTPETREPDKCEGWEWYDPAALPSPLFPSVRLALHAMEHGIVSYDMADVRRILQMEV